jgi:hypothetical protein
MFRDRIAFAGVGLWLLGIAAIFWVGTSRGVFLVGEEGDARWIAVDTDGWPGTHRIAPRGVAFRTTFRLEAPVPAAAITLQAIERTLVELDGAVLYRDAASDPRGSVEREVPLGAIAAGEHVLVIYVLASASPPLLWARSDILPVATGKSWEFALAPGGSWRAARVATDGPEPFALSREFPHAGRAFVRMLPFLVPLFLLVALIEYRGKPRPTPAQLRWGLLAIWFGIAANNLFSVPEHIGMDLRPHLAYVVHLVEQRSIPLATQGDEMMQAPLAYLLFAPLFLGLSQVLDAEGVVQGMRILPMACGAAQVELSYRAVRIVHPDREDLQRAGILVGGLLPVNIYLAHAVANEPVVALFGGAAAVAALGVAMRAEPPPRSHSIGAGILLGLALLSKVTAVLLAPASIGVVALRAYGPDRSKRRALLGAALVTGSAALVAAWYYARNWVLLGAPFVGSWQPGVSGAPWWQEPGYRSASQYLRFGEALAHPIYAAIVGLWDGLYASLWLDGGLSGMITHATAPPWNEGPLLAGAWLGAVPSLALALGALRALCPARGAPAQQVALRVAAGSVALYVAAILYLHLTVPFYCIAKASYLAATTPLLAVLAATGLESVGRARWARALAAGALACWAGNVVATYWVR